MKAIEIERTDPESAQTEPEGGEGSRLSALDRRVRRWLDTPDPDEVDAGEADPAFDAWLLGRMARNAIFRVGDVMVDEDLLDARFACVPERCSPAVDRGKWKSCCADLTVYLTGRERRRIKRHAEALAKHLAKREPRLRKRITKWKKGKRKSFWLDSDGDALCRPDERCVFSRIDGQGRIRCHLHKLARKLDIDQTDVQPITCRLFPLVLVDMPEEKVLLTVVNAENHKAWGGKHPRHFPCLSDPELPPALESMGPTLDWLFGAGFAAELQRAGESWRAARG
ncbi:MAG: DUF3109 family protein [Deltaproteobacteria bacterium]|nr:DUF3109 family protein [Deltaproteobacteria bacterium]